MQKMRKVERLRGDQEGKVKGCNEKQKIGKVERL